MDQMGVGIGLLPETKIVDKRYTRSTSGYQVRCSKLVSGHQGGVALIWKENHPDFLVELVLTIHGPNITHHDT